jgi:hypothetical protein
MAAGAFCAISTGESKRIAFLSADSEWITNRVLGFKDMREGNDDEEHKAAVWAWKATSARWSLAIGYSGEPPHFSICTGEKNASPINPYRYPSAVVWALLKVDMNLGIVPSLVFNKFAGDSTRHSASKTSSTVCTPAHCIHQCFIYMLKYAKAAVVPPNLWNGACIVMAARAVEEDEISAAELVEVD